MKPTLNELPIFSPWPARLLGLEQWANRLKTPQKVNQEFEQKWTPLLNRAKQAKQAIGLEKVNSWTLPTTPILVWLKNQLQLSTPRNIHQEYLQLVSETLMKYLPASNLVELGSGYGRIILALMKRQPFKHMKAVACEYTQSGRELTRLIAVNQSTNIIVGSCDFRTPGLTKVKIPTNSLIFTSFATHYVPKLKVRFIKDILKFKPKAIIHFEPCYEHRSNQTLLGMMQKRYIEINDYNRNLVTLLKKQQQLGRIKIIEEQKTVFGQNPLLPLSILVWRLR